MAHPGASSTGSNFVSPYHPPPGHMDFATDVANLDPDAWHPVEAGGAFWRAKTPSPTAMELLVEILERKNAAQLQGIGMFVAAHVHTDDMMRVLERMADPEDAFGHEEYLALYRAVVTAGTARPFSRSWDLPGVPYTTGAPSARSWRWQA